MRYLRQNTATRVTVGPFIAVANGTTPLTAITATSEHLNWVVDDAGVPTLVIDTTATASAGNNDLVFITGSNAGYCDLELTAAQTNYVGRACLSINFVTDHLPVFHEFMIMPALVYDTFFAASGGATFPAATLASTTNITAATGVTLAATTGLGNQTANITGNLSGSVDSVTGAVGSVTGAVGSVTGNVGGNVAGTVGTVNALAANAITAAATATDFSTEVVAAMLAGVVEGTVTVRQSLQLSNAAAAGKVAGAGTTAITLRDLGDTKNRISAVVDGDGNRTTVTPSYD
jgi:hypothetical protein